MLTQKDMCVLIRVVKDIRVLVLGILILKKNTEMSMQIPARFMISFTKALTKIKGKKKSSILHLKRNKIQIGKILMKRNHLYLLIRFIQTPKKPITRLTLITLI